MEPLTLTLYPRLRAVDEPAVVRGLTWDDVVGLFSTHHRGLAKEDMPGFGPYEIVPPPAPCHHKFGVKEQVHRCDACVTHLTMGVFDVDVGTPEQVQTCELELEHGGLTRLWYSSWSFRPDQEKPSLRLVLPFSRPVRAEVWASFREHVIRRYRIPADIKKCGGLSHFYYLPACPEGSSVEPLFHETTTGKTLDPGTVPVIEQARLSPRRVVELMAGWTPPDDPQGPVDLTPFHEKIEAKAGRLARSNNVTDRERAKALRRLVQGEALADKGGRNATTASVVMTVCGMFPGSSTKELLTLVRDSLHAMQQAGSSLTEDTVLKQIQSGMRKMAESELQRQELEKAVRYLADSAPVVSVR